MLHQVGKHSFRIAGDVLYVKYVSSVSLEDLQQMDAIVSPLIDLRSNIYLVYDVSEAGLMSPPARRYSAEMSKERVFAAVIIYGATLFTRAAIALVLSAVRLLAKNLPEIVYLQSEHEADGWIAEHRLRAKPELAVER